jgi:hypothetical protein
MTEAASSQPLHELITDTLQTLDEAFVPRVPVLSRYGAGIAGGVGVDLQLAAIATALRTTLTVLAASIGECQISLPYAAIQLVRHADGSREWCCSHTPQHCDPA